MGLFDKLMSKLKTEDKPHVATHHTTEFKGPHGDMMRWDAETNQPRGFILGASPGFASFAPTETRLSEKGLARKVMKGSRMGFDFIQIDFETISEINEQELKELMTHVKTTQQVELGIHAPVTGQNALDLGIAYTPFWDRHHRNLQRTAYAAAEKCGAKYILAHTSHSERPKVTFFVGSGYEQRMPTVSHDGINLAEFIDRLTNQTYEDPRLGKKKIPKETPDGRQIRDFKDWFKAKFVNVLFSAMGVPGNPGLIAFFDEWMLERGKEGFKSGEDELRRLHRKNVEEIKLLVNEEIDKITKPLESEIESIRRKYSDVNAPPEVAARYNQLVSELSKWKDPSKSQAERESIESKVLEANKPLYQRYRDVAGAYGYLQRDNFDSVFEYWRRHGSECDESTAYKVIAKYMYLVRDPLWLELVGDHPKLDPDFIILAADRGKTKFGTFSDGGKKFTELPEIKKDITNLVFSMITAVACKYIQGHVLTKESKWQMGTLIEGWITNEEDKKLSLYDYLKKHKVQLFFETEQPAEGLEGRLRVLTGFDHIALVKNIDDGELTAVTLDFEHLSTNLINPLEDIKHYPEGSGKYIRMCHTNAPRPYPGEHAPLYVNSRDMITLYRWFWKLKEKGVHNAYIIWEMGSYGVQQSAIALRNIVQYLMKDIAPEKLPPEFYGLDATFEARQFVAIREHAWDPLEGMVAHNEETWTLLGEQAKSKGKLQEWLRSKYK